MESGSGTSNPRWPPSGGALPAPNNDRKGLGPHPAHQFTVKACGQLPLLPRRTQRKRQKRPNLKPNPFSPDQFSLSLFSLKTSFLLTL